jgi:hypothetical protein
MAVLILEMGIPNGVYVGIDTASAQGFHPDYAPGYRAMVGGVFGNQ